LTYPISTLIANRAGIAIIAGCCVINKLAAGYRITTVIGADVSIITGKRRPRHTFITDTSLRTGTHIVIGAVTVIITFTTSNQGKYTAVCGITCVIGTAVSIITAYRISRLTGTIFTLITCRADTAIITGRCVINKLTARHRVT